MKNKSSIFLISLLVLAGLMFMASTPTVQADSSETIVIGTTATGPEFNRTEIQLQPNVEYTIVFVNTQVNTKHNLRIDVNQDVEDKNNVDDENDILVGAPNDSPESTGEDTNTWNATWTPSEDGEYIFYCGTNGHYPGMEGVFIVGEGESPGFGLFAGVAALLATALAIPQIRRR